MATNGEKLDAAKQKFLDAKNEIEELREIIAAEACPLKVGDVITVVEDGKEIEVRVDHIHPIASPDELLGPVVGEPSGWAAGGPRRNKTSGDFGKWTLTINSFDCKLVGDRWIVSPPKSIEERLGLSTS